MPELPEVEVTRRGLSEILAGEQIHRVTVREPRLRWPIDPVIGQGAVDEARCTSIDRRAKYLVLRTTKGDLIAHLGMSGAFRVESPTAERDAHDHWWIELADGREVRYRDPRRFGSLFLTPAGDAESHALLSKLGPEPFDDAFSGEYLHGITRRRKRRLRDVLLDSRVVAGVGNIYASEAAHYAGIHPLRMAGRIARARYVALVDSVRDVLRTAIERGGTTLRDFHAVDGDVGENQLTLAVYGREGEPCSSCGSEIRRRTITQRSAYWCPNCQS